MVRSKKSPRGTPSPGQLLLFPPEAEPSEEPVKARAADPAPVLPDLRRVFDELNARFFEGLLVARVEWSERLVAYAGYCRTRERLIRLSARYHRRKPDAVTATMAHEMCHLVAPGHGAAFRALARPIARALGVPWKKFRYSERWVDLRRYRYVYSCPECGHELPSAKRRTVACGRCSGGCYDERFRMTLAESRARPGPVLLGQRAVRSS